MGTKGEPVREKPHRLERQYYCGEVVIAFTACVADRQRVFCDGPVVTAFLEILSRALEKHRCLVHIYCFMPDHRHLLLQGKDGSADLWQAMVDFKQRSGFWFGQNRPEVRWQKDFYDHIVRLSEDLGAQVRYIANNPVRAGLVRKWQAYPHTGAIGIDLHEVMQDTTTL
jgi:putative transposase